MSQSRE